MNLQDILAAVQAYDQNADLELLRKAHTFVAEKHKGQTRASGEPYIAHVREVAYLTTKLRLDVPSIAAALLHDTVEDTEVSVTDIEESFGKEIAQLVDGVTKMSQVKFSSRAEEQAENFRKMLISMAKDIRVLLIKLCDRVHNMRTLEYLSESRRLRISQETVDIYAPLAHRLGIYWLKSELEDLSLRYLKPAVYSDIKQHVKATKSEREKYTREVVGLINSELEKNGIIAQVSGRPKHFFSIFQKMQRQNLSFQEIYDLIAFRIIAASPMECYAALGVVHAAWKPIPGRFKDYIAIPKPNRYQSLHTTVIGPHGWRIEIQIRTKDMHDIAEKGIAAHWIYKNPALMAKPLANPTHQFDWLRDMIESEKAILDPVEFMSGVKDDLPHREVYVFSPKGDVLALPAGSTPIDFAYQIHSEIGNHCVGARVDGRQVPLAYKLRNGDTIEIVTSASQLPNKDWLSLVATTKAKQRIRSFLKAEERERSINVGKEILNKDLRKVKLSLSKLLKSGELQQIAESLGVKETELLFAEIGYGKVTSQQVVEKLLPDDKDLDTKLAQDDSALTKIFQRAARVFRDRTAVKVNGLDDVVFHFAKCCEPLPGDDLVGFITRGRGVTVHTRGCPQAMMFDQRRLVPVSWDTNVKTTRRIKLRVYCLDRLGILASLSQTISAAGANIVAAQMGASSDGTAIGTFEVSVESANQLKTIQRNLEKISGVIEVERYRKQPAEQTSSGS